MIMSLLNITDFAPLPDNATVPAPNIYGDAETFMSRLDQYWLEMSGSGLGTILCIYIAYLSLFNKKIKGDYKWFILNQAIANFFSAFGLFIWDLVIHVYLGMALFKSLRRSGSPLWLTWFVEIIGNEFQSKFGEYAQMTTLFATVFNRWMKIVLPSSYITFMTPRSILLYCILCYVIILPLDHRLYDALNLPDISFTVANIALYMVPWLLSLVLSVSLWIKLWKHKNSVSRSIDEELLKDHRNVLYTVTIQIALPLFDKVPMYFFYICVNFHLFTEEAVRNHPIGYAFQEIRAFNYYMSNVYTCLVILLTMRAYREAAFSKLFPLIKFLKRRIKPHSENSQTALINMTQNNFMASRIE